MQDISGTPVTALAGVEPGSRVDYALRYAALGMRVLPLHWIEDGRCSCGSTACKSPGKHPLTVGVFTGGVHSATVDESHLRDAFTQYPAANIGVAMSETMIAIDIDPRNGGNETWDDFTNTAGLQRIDTVEAITGSGGRHLLFGVAGGHFAGKLGRGVDVKASGGFIVVEPSTHISGRAYAWEASSSPLDGVVPAPIPPALAGAILRPDPSLAKNGLHLSAVYSTSVAQVEELRDALTAIDADDYHTWIKAGHALKTLGDVGFTLWDEYSQRSPKYKASEMAKRWVGFSDPRASYRSIFGMAQDAGWKNPLSKGSQKKAEPAPEMPNLFDDVADLVANIKPVRWTVRNYIEQDTTVLLFGKPGTAKSFVAVHVSSCIATGTPFFGNEVKQGAVFYIAGEGHNGLARRFRAWEIENDIRIPKGVLFKSQCSLDMLHEDTVKALAAHIESKGEPAMVVIDTLARNFGGGDENSTEDMNTFVNLVDEHIRMRFGCNVLVVHHSGKDSARGARGSTALLGAVDACYEMVRDVNVTRLVNVKMKDAEPPAEMLLNLKGIKLPDVLDDRGEVCTSAVLARCADELQQVVGTDNRKAPITARDVLMKLLKGPLPLSALGEALNVSKATAGRIVGRCVDAGWLDKGSGEPVLTVAAQEALSRTGAFLVAADKPVWKRDPGAVAEEEGDA